MLTYIKCIFMTIWRDTNHIINAILIILFTFIRFSALAVKGNFFIYRPPNSCLHQAHHMLKSALTLMPPIQGEQRPSWSK